MTLKDDSGAHAVFTEQGSSASQITATKVLDVIARLPDCDGQAAAAISAYTQVKLEDSPRLSLTLWPFGHLTLPISGVQRSPARSSLFAHSFPYNTFRVCCWCCFITVTAATLSVQSVWELLCAGFRQSAGLHARVILDGVTNRLSELGGVRDALSILVVRQERWCRWVKKRKCSPRKARERTTKDETRDTPDDKTYFGAQRCLQTTLGLEPSALSVRCAL